LVVTFDFTVWRDRLRPWFAPAVVALITWLTIFPCVDPGGSYPRWPEGPGLTVDEIFNVQQGVYLAELLRTDPIGLFDPAVIREAFSLPDHPPLGRLWLGVHHQLMWRLCPPDEPEGPFVVACARTGSATAFALTVLLVGGFTSLWTSRWAGLMAALAVALLPRAYGHAHLAALETCTGLTFTAAVLVAAHTWSREFPPSWRTAAWTGAIFGLALLTKIQAVFIPIPLVVWALVRWRTRALRPLLVWGVIGFIVFFIGWPWLWLDPLDHLRTYFAGTTNRAELSAWMWGRQYTDRTVPRVYALFSFGWIMPVKFLFFGALGMIGRFPSWSRSPSTTAATDTLPWTSRETLLVMELVFPIVMFSLPRVPVYDVERLWLPAAPLFAVFVGRGAELIWRRVQTIWKGAAVWVRAAILGLMVVQVNTLVWIAPCYLSHYGGMVFGLHGASRRGLELNYWGDAVTRGLLEQVVATTPRGATIAVAPVLHQFQVEELLRQSPILRRHGVKLVAYDPGRSPTDYVLLFRRQADLAPELRAGPVDAELVAEVSRYDVQLASLYRMKRPSSASSIR
jgi:4-amino-4-deoxy-L-arabinose transferase-like glycosyltransferase